MRSNLSLIGWSLAVLVFMTSSLIAARPDSNRWLYDRNKTLMKQKQKRQRFYKCKDCQRATTWEVLHDGQQKMYFEPGEHPDAAGNEDR